MPGICFKILSKRKKVVGIVIDKTRPTEHWLLLKLGDEPWGSWDYSLYVCVCLEISILKNENVKP